MKENSYITDKTNLKLKNFMQFPLILLSEEYKELSIESKFLYMIMFDRIKLSKQNSWIDKDGKIYIFYTYKSIKEDTGMSEPTISKKMKELQDYNLILKKSTGKNKPDKIYLKNFSTTTKKTLVPLLKKLKYRHLKNLSTTTKKTLVQALKKFKSNQSNINQSNINQSNINQGQKTKQKNNSENKQREIMQKIEIIVGNFLNPNEIQLLMEHQKDTGQDWELILKAYEFVEEKRKSKNAKYVTAILNNWYKDYGIRTVEELEKVKKDKEAEKLKGTGYNKSAPYLKNITKEDIEKYQGKKSVMDTLDDLYTG